MAEEEIRATQIRHSEPLPVRDPSGKVIGTPGPLWRSFRLLPPQHALIHQNETLYRVHCQEILHRVAARQDTRPGTDVEILAVLHDVSLRTPIRGHAVGLYFRILQRRFPAWARQIFENLPLEIDDYERMYGTRMDEDETLIRARLRQDWRRLPPPWPSALDE
ncbi:hypothetical protein AGRA3207_007516 [Actinomadura graeca]|uniref:HD domain-containing protein n=1 Tax=Actinomadura graeca TaxID=2750812 RepID=A0ABX8R852_9ACTN|nr:hypothetical protein [Actinomadura graeca]QXJ25947.1 hypothetical protein AGRA3207_007516 [Actinomadura graeca]